MPAVSAAPNYATAPATTPVPPPAPPNSGKSSSQAFTHVIGSLLVDEEAPSASPNPKKAPQFPSGLISSFTDTIPQTDQPAILPITLHLPSSLQVLNTLKSSRPAPAKKGEDGGTETIGLASTAPVPLIVSSLAPLVELGIHTQTAKSGGSETQERVGIETPAQDATPKQLPAAPKAPETQVKSELAFSARIVPVAAAPSPTTAKPSPHQSASSRAAGEPSAPSSGDSAPPPAVRSEAPDSNGDESSEPQKPVARYQGKTSPVTAGTVPDLNLPSPAAASTSITAAVPVTAPSPSGPFENKPDASPAPQPIDSRPAVAALPEMSAAAKSEPVRDLSLRLGDGPSNQVNVKIQERAGEVHVAVLSSSPALTSDLRQQVGELVVKLDRAGYHAETFKPGQPASAQSTSGQSSSQQKDSSGGQPQQDTRQQGRQKRPNQAQWLEQINGSLASTPNKGKQTL